mmetsp:Transcript_49772/g.79352  ORF Transcript_49772/g.79352 Transcript_49772/m.79352 type:complete len:452 (-) Transcript_49772:97-1452(-)
MLASSSDLGFKSSPYAATANCNAMEVDKINQLSSCKSQISGSGSYTMLTNIAAVTPLCEDDGFSLSSISKPDCSIENDPFLRQHGYQRIEYLGSSLQGTLYKVMRTDTGDCDQHRDRDADLLLLHKIDKTLYSQHIGERDGMTFCVNHDLLQETKILQYLQSLKNEHYKYVVQYVDLLQSPSFYYALTEYVEHGINLKQFVDKSWLLIRAGKLKYSHYVKIMKYIYWQIVCTMQWLHVEVKCCHLNLCLQNVVIQNGNFINSHDDSITIDPNIVAKLAGFEYGEVFGARANADEAKTEKAAFECDKIMDTFRDIQYLSPKMLNEEKYDAAKADIWALGIMLFHSMTGRPLYDKIEFGGSSNENAENGGYHAAMNGKLGEYLQANHLHKYVNKKMLALLDGMITKDESLRFDSNQIQSHDWFKIYFAKYKRKQLRLRQNTVIKSIVSAGCYL